MIVTIDIGNSRIKWAGWRDGVIVARGSAVHAGGSLSDDFFHQLFAVPFASGSPDQSDSAGDMWSPSQIFAVCVADQDIRRALDLWIEQNWAVSIDYLQTQKHYKDIIHAYAEPSQYGADRWAALIAAQKMFPGAGLCVISAGTAITFDFIDKQGQHLGGYILPSFRTMHKALTADTANVISAAEVFRDDAGNNGEDNLSLPVNTNDAVNAGLHRLLRSGIRDICATGVNDRTDDAGWQIVITGGGAEEVLAYPDMPVMQHVPDLVMLGLYEVLNREDGAAG